MKRSLVVLVALALVGYLGLNPGTDGSRFHYLTAPVERGDLVTTTTATGTIEAVVTVKVGSQLSGQVDELFVDFNDEVEKGQAIAQLDQQSFAARVQEARAALAIAEASVRMEEAAVQRARSSLKRAQARTKVLEGRTANAGLALERAERELARAEELRSRGTIAVSALEDAQTERDILAVERESAEAERAVHEQEIVIARADLLAAEAKLANAEGSVLLRKAVLEQAEVELERTVIRAPIDGVVIGRNIDRGQTVAASLEAPTLFTIAQDLRRMEVHAKIDEADIGRIELGQRAFFTVDSYPRRRFTGKVTQIRKAPQAVENVVAYTVLIATGNPDLALLPGMTAIIQIVVAEVSDVLRVPNAALRFSPPESAAGAAEEATEATDPDATGPDATGPDATGTGEPATVWLERDDGGIAPVRIGTGAADPNATELASGPLSEGDAVVVGYRQVTGGWTFFGLELGL